MTDLPMILGMLFWLGWALFCCLALFVAKDENKYLKSLMFSMFMTMLVIKMGGY
ncbi:hypothetical protein AB1I77_27320 [Bacillus paranthracis]|uniref:hypothetical protein n=1 Tax=Bacillus TaxID=1386 RepID=UPI0012B7F83F|nr:MULTISPECIES: hypothetical protein [Bacillus]NIA61108.1 hypothetical protein [Bacillus pacificus]MBY0132072.1 hypothetical protein [Bacillus cereus]MCD9104165.1 hypothetical protein [Bacillus sp. PLB03]MDA1662942.1 hypothetical protein [Bacillus cereus group sp. TH153LC]MDG0881789.1 hypothetical protein [Bacillus paranthracis]